MVNREQNECRDVEGRRIIQDGSMDLNYCKGNSTIILSSERETGKWNGWKGLAGIWEFGETDCGSVYRFEGLNVHSEKLRACRNRTDFKTRTLNSEGMRHPSRPPAVFTVARPAGRGDRPVRPWSARSSSLPRCETPAASLVDSPHSLCHFLGTKLGIVGIGGDASKLERDTCSGGEICR